MGKYNKVEFRRSDRPLQNVCTVFFDKGNRMWQKLSCFWDLFQNVKSRRSGGREVHQDAKMFGFMLSFASSHSDSSDSLLYSSLCFIFQAGSESEVAALQEIAWRCVSFTSPHLWIWPPTPASSPHLHLLIKPEDVAVQSHLSLWGFTCFHIQSVLRTNPNPKL